jgi:hypothetical protein
MAAIVARPDGRCFARLWDRLVSASNPVESGAIEVLQRLDWQRSPIDLGELFIVKKNGCEAICKMAIASVRLGTAVVRRRSNRSGTDSGVPRSQDEVLTTGEQWKAAMMDKGWH